MLTGNNGILAQVQDAKEQTEVAEEKEIVVLATIEAMSEHPNRELTLENLRKSLNSYSNDPKISVVDNGDGTFTVTFPSGSVFLVDEDGNIEYLGTQKELIEKVTITADKESNDAREFVQTVELTVNTYLPVEDSDIALLYGWTTSNEQEPTEQEYMTASLTGSKLNRTATVSSTVTTEGNYYLWVKVIVNGKETTKIYGTYAIREFTTLKVCSSEQNASSYFLGSNVVNTNITRNAIRSIEIEDSLEGYSGNNSNCWDVSQKQDGSILASYSEVTIDGNTYYDIKIASDGKVAANPNSSYLFAYVGYNLSEEVTITGLENLDTSFVTKMGYMFYNCNRLTNLDVSNFDTSSVTSINNMFYGCSSLTNLDVSKFNTSNVTTMVGMFMNCNSLTSLDVSKFNTSNVTSMESMFRGCSNLKNLNLSNFNTSSVTDMARMFQSCSILTNLDVSKFNTSSVTSMSKMFQSCSSLTNLDVSKFNTSNVTDMELMFYSCSSLTNLNVSNFNTSSITDMSNMFYGCNSLTSLDVSKFDTSSVTDMGLMFYGCSSLTNLDVSKFETSSVTNMATMFTGCSSLISLDVSKFNTSSVTSMTSMFDGCSSLTKLDLSKFNTSSVTNMNRMFRGCSSLTNLDLSNFDITNVTDSDGMFNNVQKTIKITTNSATATWLKENFSFITDDNIELVT